MRILRQNSKAIGAGTGAALASLLIWGLGLIPGVEIPPEIQAAIGVLITAIITWWFPANEPVPVKRSRLYPKDSSV